MFDRFDRMDTGGLSQQLRDTADLLDAFAPSTDVLKSLQGAKNAIEAAQADLVREMAETLEHETAGYASPKGFLTAELGLDARQAHTLIAAGPTLRDLPEVAHAAHDGEISLDHVRHFTYALKHVGTEATRSVLPNLVDVAVKAEPAALRPVMQALREAVYPDSLDQQWINGMAREDINLSAVPDGFHVHGFLNSTTGVKFKTLLQSLSAPAGPNDPRTPAQRRVDGLDTLLTKNLGAGLPGDQGVRPHVKVTVDADTLTSDTGTAELLGFGPIGVRQVRQILCDASITPVVVERTGKTIKTKALGHSMRLASKAQRTAIEVQQHDQCAAPGCHAPIIDIHHVIWWSHGGKTTVDNLIGLCPRCHRAVHAGTLIIDPVTHEFGNRRGLRLAGSDPHDRPRRRLRPARVRAAHYRTGRHRSALPSTP